MSNREKIIKLAATVLAIILALAIIGGIFAGLSMLFGFTIFSANNNSNTNSYQEEIDFDMDLDMDDDWDTNYDNHNENHNSTYNSHNNHSSTNTSSSNSETETLKANSYDTTNISSFFDNVTSLEIDALIYEVNIMQGTSDKIQVECENVIEDYVVEQKNDGTLRLYGKGVAVSTGGDALDRLADFLDGKTTFNENWNGSISIFLPENYKLKDCEIFGGTGAIKISGLTCDTLDLDLGIGALTGDYIECNKIDLDSGTGNITLTNVVFQESDIDCGTGLVEISGRLLGESDIACGVGKLDLTLEDYKEDYIIDIEKGLGNLTVNGNIFNEFHSTPSGASHYLEIEGGVGDINIDFGHSF